MLIWWLTPVALGFGKTEAGELLLFKASLDSIPKLQTSIGYRIRFCSKKTIKLT